MSPVSVKVKYNYDSYNSIAPMPRVVVKNQDEKELIYIFYSNSENGNRKDKKYMSGEFEFIGNEKNITVIPSLYIDDKVNLFKDGKVEIDSD